MNVNADIEQENKCENESKCENNIYINVNNNKKIIDTHYVPQNNSSAKSTINVNVDANNIQNFTANQNAPQNPTTSKEPIESSLIVKKNRFSDIIVYSLSRARWISKICKMTLLRDFMYVPVY